MITWNTPAGSLGVITERVIQDIVLSASSDVGPVTYSLIAGTLPRGLRLKDGHIIGSPTEVRKFTESRFVIRADDGEDIEDRTFGLSVDGSDIPEWVTREGFLNLGPGGNFFVLDNGFVDFQLEVNDTDVIAGDTLEFYLAPFGGALPPGLSLTRDGRITGYTDPIFALEYTDFPTGGYDVAPLDVTPLDFVEARTNGFDDYFYDTVTYDYTDFSRIPRRLSRIYSFVVSVTDGLNTVNRLFKIYVVTEEFLQADNSIVQVDTNLFLAGSTGARRPLWITESYLGRVRANNYVTIFLDVYDPPSLEGTITYFKKALNEDGSPSELPPGMELDTVTGEIAGRVPYQAAITKTYKFTMVAVNFPATLGLTQYNFLEDWNGFTDYVVNDAVRYVGFIYICTRANRGRPPSTNPDFWFTGVSSTDKEFTVDIVGEIESAVEWVSPSDRGTIKPNQPSTLFVRAESKLYGGYVAYEFVSGTLPPGLEFLPTGDIAGKVKQFADEDGPGLTRFYDKVDSATVDSTPSRSFDLSWDTGTTSFDKKFTFTVKARDSVNFAESLKTFFITVIADNTKTFANLYVRALQSKEKRLSWYNFITDVTIFKPDDLYRYGDTNYGIQTDLKVLVFAGIESMEAVDYIQAMSRNHYRKRLLFGDLKVAKAKDPVTQETIYEVIYVDVVDDKEKNGKSISNTVNLADDIESKVLISYDAIKVDSDIPFVSDSDYQRVFPNSIKNMRRKIKGVGDNDREFLPLWMRSIQDSGAYELGYTKALILCYANPGRADTILARIRAANFDFKQIDFVADRYIIDIVDGKIEDKYLPFPQRAILNKYPDASSQAI